MLLSFSKLILYNNNFKVINYHVIIVSTTNTISSVVRFIKEMKKMTCISKYFLM